jgi:hypothetical protein
VLVDLTPITSPSHSRLFLSGKIIWLAFSFVSDIFYTFLCLTTAVANCFIPVKEMEMSLGHADTPAWEAAWFHGFPCL